jgi:VWFA-related protein
MMNESPIRRIAASAITGMLLGTLSIFSAGAQATTPTVDAHTIITVLPKGKEDQARVTPANLAVKVDGKQSAVTTLTHYDTSRANLELVLMIDDSARSSLGLYLKEMASFLQALPPNVAVAVAYIDNGNPHFVSPFTLDHAAAAQALRLPSGAPGANSSPYFALTALVKGWPSRAPGMRHEVVLISNGVDGYSGLRYDPSDPYVNDTINTAQKHGVIVYSIFYKDRGLAQRFGAAINSGQNYLTQMSEATGGQLYYQGFDNPVSFVPFFEEISRNLLNQYEVGLSVPPRVKDGLQPLKVKANVPNARVSSPTDIQIGEPNEKK